MSNVADIRKKREEKSAERKISVISRVCSMCQNLDDSNPIARQCSAFPDGIPLEIWNAENDHTSAYPGDNGIRFEPIQIKQAA